MADKPSRALVIYGDGLARGIDASSSLSHSHLHYLASLSSCGFLSLPQRASLSALSWDCSENEDERIVGEFPLLLAAYNPAYQITSSQHKDSAVPFISERFMGMKAAVVTNNPGLKSFCGKLGFDVLRFNDLPVRGGNGETGGEGVANDVEYVNALVDGIMQLAKPGAAVGSRSDLPVVMSRGRVMEGDDTTFSIEVSRDEMDPVLKALFPGQSYTMRVEKPWKDVRHYWLMLIARWQYAVTRVDMPEAFSFKDFKEHGGNLVIPADRFLHKVAFKL